MTLEEMRLKKRELGYSNEMIADMSGVPLGTVQKIFSGETSSPRYNTLKKLESVLGEVKYSYAVDASSQLADVALNFEGYVSNEGKKRVRSVAGFGGEKRIGVAAGKYKVPDDCFFYDDEIAEMFEG